MAARFDIDTYVDTLPVEEIPDQDDLITLYKPKTLVGILRDAVKHKCASFNRYDITDLQISTIESILAELQITELLFYQNDVTIAPDGDFTEVNCHSNSLIQLPKWPKLITIDLWWQGQIPNWTTLQHANIRGSISWSELPNLRTLCYYEYHHTPQRLSEWPLLEYINYNGPVSGIIPCWKAHTIKMSRCGIIDPPLWTANIIDMSELTLRSIPLWGVTTLTLNCIIKCKLPNFPNVVNINLDQATIIDIYDEHEKFPLWPRVNTITIVPNLVRYLPYWGREIKIQVIRGAAKLDKYKIFRKVYFAAYLRHCIKKWKAKIGH